MKKNRFLLLAIWGLTILQATAQQPCNGIAPVVQIAPPPPLTCQNPTVELQATVTPPSGLYSMQWVGGGVTSNGLSLTVNQPGAYAFFVWDSLTGCWGGDTAYVLSNKPKVQITPTFPTCAQQDDPLILTANATGGSGNFTYQWSNGMTTNPISIQTSGNYCVTITDLADGCTAVRCSTFTFPEPLETSIFYYKGSCFDSTVLYVYVEGGLPPYEYQWSDGSSWGGIFDPTAGTYTVTVTDARGCTSVTSFVVEDDLNACATLSGHVRADWNGNCNQDAGDDGLSGITLRFEFLSQGKIFYVNTDADGAYSVKLYPGAYTIQVQPPSSLWASCQPLVNLTVGPSQSSTQDFLLKPLATCPAMTIDLGNPWLRRCFTGQYWVTYSNQGTVAATDAFVEVLFDPYLTPTNASIPFTSLGNNKYRFELGTVQANHYGSFWIQVNVSCNAILGQTHCTEAVIYPIGDCQPANPQWSGASLNLSGQCQTDSVLFTIRNIGTGATTQPLEYVVIEDAVMLMQTPPPAIYLGPGQSHDIKVPANGATWRVEVAQEALHPGNSMPSLSVEGCTTNGAFSTGFVNQFPTNDDDPWVDIDCTQNVGSYDPNDKQGFPSGYGAAHYLRPGTDIEYLIRFQNTGTDTALNVVIRDELSPWLDPATVVPGASSHPYRFSFYHERNLKFTFENILLPDSSKNQAGSQGFVSFRVSPRADVPLQTNIYNAAGIYFDFNAPVYTNTTVHRIGEDFVSVSTWQPLVPGLELRVLPNPVADAAVLQLSGLSDDTAWQVTISDLAGRPLRQAQASGTHWQFERGDLPAGVYLVRVLAGGQVMGTGKLVLR